MLRCSLAAVVALSFAGFASSAAVRAAGPDFNRDIRPILSNNCFKCHGFDENQRQAGLRLDTPEGATALLESGIQAVVPGNSGQSALVTRITAENADERMPPAGSGKTLTPGQIELLRQWVNAGAEIRPHWSFIPPTRPTPPAVAHESVVRNPIDRFLVARLEAEGLSPAPQASKETLIRRVTYDLTGLPPTPAEVDAFLADASENAYETVVDRLLTSPRYGEHLARYWLDAARYGDSHGLHFDNERTLWRYREWVIDAFNRNQPFDQFTVEQLAGDLLPEATLEQRVATGFNRCNVSTSEGGSIDEEVLVRYAIDRVETTSTVWLGLTTGCAVCHDHKFDPVTQREFYQLFAFFNGVAEAAMDGNALSPPPIIKVPTAEQAARQQELQTQLAQARLQLTDAVAGVAYTEPAAAHVAPSEPHEYVWIEDDLPAGAKASTDHGGWQFVSQLDRPVYSGQRASYRQAEGLSQHYFTEAPQGLKIGAGDRLFAYVYLDPANPPKSIMLQFNDGSWEHRAFWGEDLIPFGAVNTPGKMPQGPLPAAGQWVRLEVDAAQVGLAAGATLNGWAFTQHDGAAFWDKAGIVTRTPQPGQEYTSLAAWEAAQRAAPDAALPQPVKDALAAEPAARTDEQKNALREHFLSYVYPATRESLAPLHQQIAAVNQQAAELDAAVPTTMVMADMPQPRETFMLVRGDYENKGDRVEPGVPGVLPPLATEAPRNRLGLAQWLVAPGHPLTARVAVNRYWQHYFGTGIVKTAEDFGAQGDFPTHPELLDWLAVEFVESGWNIKHVQKLMVMSGAYRQASAVTPESFERDPENLLIARGPRFRLDAEMVRDGALAMSGLLVEEIGGRSVKPYQPAGLWEAISFLGSNTGVYEQDQGDSVWRRSLYTFWKRTSPPPSLLAFDAPSRETCTVRRATADTPLQALVLMNDTQYVEAARHLAVRTVAEAGPSPAERAAYAFRLATARHPRADELEVLVLSYQEQLAEYQFDPAAAAALLEVGDSPCDSGMDKSELAAWTMVANLILNLDETVTKE